MAKFRDSLTFIWSKIIYIINLCSEKKLILEGKNNEKEEYAVHDIMIMIL